MNNEEKLEYIKEAHALTMRYRLWDKPELRFNELKALDDNSWDEFSKTLLPKIPKVLYRYRPCNEFSFDELSNGYAWFSNPVNFDDGTDSALNTDIESEIKEIEKSPEKMIVSFARAAILQQYRLLTGHDPKDKLIEEGVKIWPNGKFDASAMRNEFINTCPGVNPEPFIEMFTRFNDSATMGSVEKALKETFEFYMGFNEKIRTNLLCLCLAENNDNNVMWAKYADERSGFCIGYEIPPSNFLGQRSLMSLNPIYYGEKKPLRFFDVIIEGLTARADDQINGWTKKTYEDVHIASLTKDPEWSFQKEWRVTFSPDAKNNKQSFPFIKSIYIGKKMKPEHRQELIELANKNGWDLYERKLNKSGSKIIYRRVGCDS